MRVSPVLSLRVHIRYIHLTVHAARFVVFNHVRVVDEMLIFLVLEMCRGNTSKAEEVWKKLVDTLTGFEGVHHMIHSLHHTLGHMSSPSRLHDSPTAVLCPRV